MLLAGLVRWLREPLLHFLLIGLALFVSGTLAAFWFVERLSGFWA